MDKENRNTEAKRKEADAYARLRADVQGRLAEIRDKINRDTVRQAIAGATERLKAAGEHTAEAVNKAAEALKKDMAQAANAMGPAWEKFSEKTSDVFHVWRDRGALFLASAADAVRDWLKETTTRIENQRYEAGEMAYTGVFECTACGEHVTLTHPAHLPPCPKCMKTEFRRLS